MCTMLCAPLEGARPLPGLDLHQPQPRRAPLITAEGMARGGYPPREDRRQLHRRPLPRRSPRLDQVTTDPS